MAYLGQIAEIPIGFDGLTGSKNASQILPGELVRAQSVEYAAGTLQKEGGAAKYNSTAITGAPAVIGGWDWHPAEGLQRMIVVTSAGAMLRDDGAATFPTQVAGGPQELLTRADTNLYHAKHAGKNRVNAPSPHPKPHHHHRD